MSRVKNCAVLSVAGVLMVTGTAAAQVASLRLLPARTTDGGVEVSALYSALSSDGNVLGGVYRTVAGAAGERALVRVNASTLAVTSRVSLATTQGSLTGLSSDGAQAIGNARFTGLAGQPTGGFVEGPLAAAPLPGVSGNQLYTALGISQNGAFITGTAPVGQQGLDRCVLWTQGAVMYGPPATLPGVGLGTVRGKAVVEGLGGEAIVAGTVEDFSTFFTRPFVWTSNAPSLESLPLPIGESSGRTADLSTSGNVVVGPLGDGVERFGRWQRVNATSWNVLDLGRISGSTTAEPVAVSADGNRIVGSAIINGSAQAVLWDASVGHRRLDVALASRNVVLPAGLSLLRIDGVSDDGVVMYGLAQQAGNEVQTFIALLPRAAACGAADVGGEGAEAGSDGSLDNNDFIVFIDRFFAEDVRADFGSEGGAAGPDGTFDNNDFIVFIAEFFGAC
jgi:uncharacterized membrane protein